MGFETFRDVVKQYVFPRHPRKLKKSLRESNQNLTLSQSIQPQKLIVELFLLLLL